MDVRIRFSDGKLFHLELWYFDTILEIKKKIRKYLGIPIFRQKLYDSNGRGLMDKRDTEFYKIIQGSTLLLQVINPGNKTRDSDNEDEVDNNYTACSSRTMIRLLIKVELTKREFKLEMQPSDTVGCLRARIREYEALPIIRLVLSSGAALGDDNKTLSHYGLVAYSKGKERMVVSLWSRRAPQANSLSINNPKFEPHYNKKTIPEMRLLRTLLDARLACEGRQNPSKSRDE